MANTAVTGNSKNHCFSNMRPHYQYISHPNMAHKYKQGNWLRLFINCVFIINGDDVVVWKCVYERFGKATIFNENGNTASNDN